MPTYSGISLSQLEELINSEADDILPITDVSTGNTKKITRENLLKHLAQNIADSGTGVSITGGANIGGNSNIDGDLEVENEIIAGGDISTSGDVSFGSLTDYLSGVTVYSFANTANAITNTLADSSIPTSGALKSYLGTSKSYSRTTLTATTSSLTQNDSANINISAFKGYFLYTIATDSAAWVRIYCDSASRSADKGRVFGTLASDSSGLLVEVNTTGAETIKLSPGIVGYNNSTPVIGVIPAKIVKRTPGTASSGITVTLTALQTED
jgi:hypothetical protein